MIRAVAWFCADHYGVMNANGWYWKKPSPKISAASEILAVVGRPINYFSRMPTEARHCLCAAAAAMESLTKPDAEVGLLSCSTDGWIAANQDYFRDYVAEGRSLGRGNLFIYTLPTSVLGELAIVLSLKGPCLFWQDSAHPPAELICRARDMVDEGEADAMLALWSDANGAICYAIEEGEDDSRWPEADNPLQMIGKLQARVQCV